MENMTKSAKIVDKEACIRICCYQFEEEIMKYILWLALKKFKNNKIKNSIVILAIAIAFSFVGIYFVFVDALNAFFLQSNLRQMGTEAEAEYRNVTYEEYLQFKKENRTLHCSYGTRLEQWTVGEYNSRQVVLNYMEKEAAGLCFAVLTEGTWPEKENEVAIDKNYGRYIEEIPIGSEIVISGVRYVVSGICDSNSKAEYASIYLSGQAFAKYKTAAAGIVYVDAEGRKLTREYLAEEWSAVFPKGEPEIVVNAAYEQKQSAADSMVRAVAGILVFMAAYASVYSVYSNSLVKDVPFYGLLRLQGMTKKQLYFTMQTQAFFQYIIAIPVGCFLTGVIFMAAKKHFLPEFFGENRYLTGNCEWFVWAIGITLLAVILGTYRPIRFLLKLSMSEAQNCQPNVRVKVPVHNPKRYCTLRFAYRNLQRNRMRSFAVILSTSISVLLFVLTISFAKYLKNGYSRLEKTDYDFIVARESVLEARENSILGEKSYLYYSVLTGEPEAELTEELIRKLQDACHGAEVKGRYLFEAFITSDAIVARVDDYIAQGKYKENELRNLQLSRQNAQNLGCDELWSYMQYYVDFDDIADWTVTEGCINRKKFESGEYVILATASVLKGQESFFHPGEKIPVKDKDGVREAEVLAVVADIPQICMYEGFITCFLPKTETDDNGGILYAVTIDAKDAEKEETAVRDIVHNSPEAVSYVSYEMVRQEEKNGLRILETIGGGISLAAGIMAFLNFVHNAVANRIERKAEYDILRKIGMTKRQLKHLIRAENGILFGIAAVIGCIAGVIISTILLRT